MNKQAITFTAIMAIMAIVIALLVQPSMAQTGIEETIEVELTQDEHDWLDTQVIDKKTYLEGLIGGHIKGSYEDYCNAQLDNAYIRARRNADLKMKLQIAAYINDLLPQLKEV